MGDTHISTAFQAATTLFSHLVRHNFNENKNKANLVAANDLFLQKKKKSRKFGGNGEIINVPEELETLFNEIITQPFDNHVALPRSQRLIVYTNDQGLAGLLNSNATRTLV